MQNKLDGENHSHTYEALKSGGGGEIKCAISTKRSHVENQIPCSAPRWLEWGFSLPSSSTIALLVRSFSLVNVLHSIL